MKLSGKVAVIAGGSKGIGFGCAKVFGKYGARVVLAARGDCLLYTSPSPRDGLLSRMPSSA